VDRVMVLVVVVCHRMLLLHRMVVLCLCLCHLNLC